jgi:apolipoprotein D and lipocalin family protein
MHGRNRWALARCGLAGALSVAFGCGGKTPLATVGKVDLARYMGDWYVIACIPTWFERDAYDAIESYQLAPDGSVATQFHFRRGGFDEPPKTYESTGFVRGDGSNARWDVQFVWPLRSEYLIVALDPGYEWVMVARTKRDHAWIMSRTPELDDATYRDLVQHLQQVGYDTAKLVRVPHAPAVVGDVHERRIE